MRRLVLTIAGAVNAGGARTGVQRVSYNKVRRSIFRILNDNVLCSMATVSDNGRAHINTAYFSFTADLELYFLSHPDSTHCRNLATNPSMAVSVFSSEQSWSGPDQGVQLFGTCRQTRGSLVKQAVRSYGGRFRQYAKWNLRLKPNGSAREYRFYRFVPTYIKVFDEAAFGDAVFVRVILKRRGRLKRT